MITEVSKYVNAMLENAINNIEFYFIFIYLFELPNIWENVEENKINVYICIKSKYKLNKSIPQTIKQHYEIKAG